MVIPTPDSGILKRLYANLLGSGGAISLDIRKSPIFGDSDRERVEGFGDGAVRAGATLDGKDTATE